MLKLSVVVTLLVDRAMPSVAMDWGQTGKARPDTNNQVWEAQCEPKHKPLSGECNLLGSVGSPTDFKAERKGFWVVGSDNAWQCTWNVPIPAGAAIVRALCE